MIKQAHAAVLALSVLAIPAAFAAEPKPCSPEKTAGTYVAVGNEINATAEFIDQLELHGDGTATWWQSTNAEGLMSSGSGSRQLGSWKCVSATSLIVTTIGMRYRSTQITDPDDQTNILRDVVRDTYVRGLHAFAVVDRNTLNRTHRAFRYIDLGENPLDPNAPVAVLEASDLQRPFRRVIPLTSDRP
jgi:hypothetical protein